LSGHSAELLEFPFVPAIAHLTESVSGLYDWLAPHMPEDLAVYTTDGSVCLLSCAYERFAELRLNDADAGSLPSLVPGLAVRRIADR
jgi:hypothetical protein